MGYVTRFCSVAILPIKSWEGGLYEMNTLSTNVTLDPWYPKSQANQVVV